MNYGDLKTYVQDVLGRSDIPNAAYAAAQDDWNRKLRLQESQATATLLPPYTLPDGCRSLVQVTGDNGILINAYRVSAGALEFDDDYTGSVDILYMGTSPVLVNAADTNVVLTKYAQVAIYGVLYHTCVMLRDSEGMAAFGQVYATALGDAVKADNRARFYGGQMIPTPRDAA